MLNLSDRGNGLVVDRSRTLQLDGLMFYVPTGWLKKQLAKIKRKNQLQLSRKKDAEGKKANEVQKPKTRHRPGNGTAYIK